MLTFFANAKLMLGTVAAFVFGTMFVIFKARGKEINVLGDEIEQLKAESEVNKHITSTNDEIEQIYKAELEEIDKEYEEGIEKAYSDPTVDLSPSLLSKLRNIQGLSDNYDKPTE